MTLISVTSHPALLLQGNRVLATTVTRDTLDSEASVGSHLVAVAPNRMPVDSLTEVAVRHQLSRDRMAEFTSATLKGNNVLTTNAVKV